MSSLFSPLVSNPSPSSLVKQFPTFTILWLFFLLFLLQFLFFCQFPFAIFFPSISSLLLSIWIHPVSNFLWAFSILPYEQKQRIQGKLHVLSMFLKSCFFFLWIYYVFLWVLFLEYVTGNCVSFFLWVLFFALVSGS